MRRSFRHVAGGHPYSRELNTLWKFAGALERGRGNPPRGLTPDYAFRVEGHGENVRITSSSVVAAPRS